MYGVGPKTMSEILSVLLLRCVQGYQNGLTVCSHAQECPCERASVCVVFVFVYVFVFVFVCVCLDFSNRSGLGPRLLTA